MSNGIESLFIYMTFKCNLHCLHCWASCDNNIDEPQLSNELIFRTIDEAYALGVKNIKLTGGEPFFAADKVREIIKYLEKYPDIVLRIETNGTLISDEFIELINTHHISLSISLHHWNGDMHDRFVGRKGAFDNVIRLLPRIRQKEVLVTVSKWNLNEVKMLLMKLKELNIKKVKFNVLLLVGRGEGLREEELTAIEYVQLNQIIDDFMEANPGIQVDSSSPMCLNSLSLSRPRHELSSGCSFGKICCLLPSGDISLCGWSINVRNSKLCIGNIYRNSLSEIWRNSINIIEQTYPVLGVCQKCILNNICKGGCRAVSYLAYGELNAPFPLCQIMYDNNVFPQNRLVGK